MKDSYNEIEYKGKKYKLVFNFNVMEEIQEKYGSLGKWGELTDGIKSEPDIKAIKFGIAAMIDEGISIDEENGLEVFPLTLRQVGRLITEVGINECATALNKAVIESTKSDEKNVSSMTKKTAIRP